MIPELTLNGQNGFVPRCGGASLHTAIGLSRLGCQAGLISGISTDFFGNQLLASLRASNVDTSNIVRSDRPTTLAFVQLSNGHASYSFFDENSAGKMIEKSDLPTQLDNVTGLLFGGISLACDPSAEAYMQFAESQVNSSVIMVDPNIRANFISDEKRFRGRMTRMLELADIVKVSDEDLNWLFPNSATLEEKVSKLQKLGPNVVILTCGSLGAKAWLTKRHTISVTGRNVDVVDTVGAGDAFNAGILTSLLEAGLLNKANIQSISKSDILRAVDFGTRVAAISVGRVGGANPPWRDEL